MINEFKQYTSVPKKKKQYTCGTSWIQIAVDSNIEIAQKGSGGNNRKENWITIMVYK